MFGKLNALLDGFMAAGIPGYDIAVLQDGACIWRRSDGYADMEGMKPFTGGERYNIYSCSKVITCAAALQLWKKGLFRTEDRLADYLPEYADMRVGVGDDTRPAERAITVQDLFCMTAGLDYDLASPSILRVREETDGRCPTRDIARCLAKEPLLFEPGTRWNYSLCHDVLAALVEVLSGEKFEDYTREHIFRPLGMDRTTFMLSDNELDGIAPQYRWDAAAEKPVYIGPANPYKLGSEYASGGAGCISTVDDYLKFLEALRIGDVILGRDTVSMMTTDRLTWETGRDYWHRENYGYGLGVRCPREGGVMTDFGWGGAAGAFLAVDPAHGISLYYAQHMLTPPNSDTKKNIIVRLMEDMGYLRK